MQYFVIEIPVNSSFPGQMFCWKYCLLFFDDTIFDIIVINTNLYAAHKLGQIGEHTRIKWKEVNREEIKSWLGIRVMYWSTDFLLGNLFIPQIMTRHRFDKI